ncbi:MAG TPA: thiamine phosphate synthase [Bacteroidia bacterium]|jgi:thiamine-phosphate pyrophosphorylase|nr:thiamine phosphate synthase [Bacteroidia bacterium]
MISRLHYITQDIATHPHAELARLACKGGVNWVQLRIKNLPAEHRLSNALETLAVCRVFGAKLIINDHVQLAMDCGADGVHLGKTDMPVEDARKLLGPDSIIGATANTWADLEHLASTSANYIGLGPFRFTPTKENLSPVLGLNGIVSLMLRFHKISTQPVIAIGGIQPGDIPALFKTGIHGIAVSSGIGKHQQPDQGAREYLNLIKQIPETYLSLK